MKNIWNKFLSAVILLFFAGAMQEAFSQTWSEPVQISTLQGLNNNPDFCIDKEGTIHCVWSYMVWQFHRVIYYSKSTDEGINWSEPENISQNESMWMDNPHIISDSKNNLHVAYDYQIGGRNPNVVYRYFDGQNWSALDTVSSGWAGAQHNRLVIDNNDKLYFFWFHGVKNGTEFYREKEYGYWGNIKVVYNNSNKYYLEKAVVDSANVLHCSGYHYYEDQTVYDQKIVYSTYMGQLWSELTEISQEYEAWTGNDIALDNSGSPHIIWRQALDDGAPPENGTKYSCFDAGIWSNPELIAKSASNQVLAVDNNNGIHIINNEQRGATNSLVHYQLISGSWFGDVIEENYYGFYSSKLVFKDHSLYLINLRVDTVGKLSEGNIYIYKYSVTTRIKDTPIAGFGSFTVYPNPSKGSTTIDYTIKEETPILIEVYDINGEIIDKILDKKQSVGRYQIKWNGTDKNRKEVKNGLYLIRLQAGRYFTTRPVEIVR